MRTLIIWLLFLIFGDLSANNFDLKGAWRGSMSYTRADDKQTLIYLGLNVEEEQGQLTGLANAYQIGLNAKLSSIELNDDMLLAFTMVYKNKPTQFKGVLKEYQITGVLQSEDGSQKIWLERVHRAIEHDHLEKLGGLYLLDDGNHLLLSPRNWTFSSYEFSDRSFRTFFPRTDNSFFAGSAFLEPSPIESTIEFKQAGDENVLLYTKQGVRRQGKLETAITMYEVTVPNGEYSLSAMLFLPSKIDKPLTGLAIAAGSGKQDKFGSQGLPHYRAAWLALNGYAAIIFEKRGAGKSTGSYEDRTQESMASDVAAVADYLATRPEIDRKKIGLLVHSQSGIYAPKTINMSKNISFAAVIATTLVNGAIQEIVRTEQQLRADGYSEQDINAAVTTQILKFYYADHRIGWDAYVAAYHQVKDKEWFESIIGSTIDINKHSWDFWRNGNSFEPYKEWQNINMPVLMLFGDKDPINPLQKNLEMLELAFAGEREKYLTKHVFKNQNHGLYESYEGGVFEETQLKRISSFITVIDEWLDKEGFK